jgi:sec-independent protein translocase protein TatB
MFNVGGGEIMVILLLALLVLGPDKLPEYARKAGRYMNEFRRLTSGFQEEFRSAMDLGSLGADEPTPEAGTEDGDALHRTTEGPRLVPTAEAPTAPERPVTGGSAPQMPPPAPTAPAVEAPAPQGSRGAFAADVTPAPGRGPELIVPSRPAEHPGDDAGSSSAA